jgi:hypothetical protein
VHSSQLVVHHNRHEGPPDYVVGYGVALASLMLSGEARPRHGPINGLPVGPIAMGILFARLLMSPRHYQLEARVWCLELRPAPDSNLYLSFELEYRDKEKRYGYIYYRNSTTVGSLRHRCWRSELLVDFRY